MVFLTREKTRDFFVPKNVVVSQLKVPRLFSHSSNLWSENYVCWNVFINWWSLWTRYNLYMKLKRVGREPNSGENERERERETVRCCRRVTGWINNLTIGQVIYQGQRKDNLRLYQDGNKAYPYNFWWTNVSLCAMSFHPFDKPAIYHTILPTSNHWSVSTFLSWGLGCIHNT